MSGTSCREAFKGETQRPALRTDSTNIRVNLTSFHSLKETQSKGKL